MDVLGTLQVRFHFYGEFIQNWKQLCYCGGTEGMAYIDRDKVSLPEFFGHLKDHCDVTDGMMMHWLMPGKELSNGLRALVDDNACMDVSNATDDGCVADIYVDASSTQDSIAYESDFPKDVHWA